MSLKNKEAAAIREENRQKQLELLETHRKKLEQLSQYHLRQIETITEDSKKEKDWYCAKVKKLQGSHEQQTQILQEQINTNNAKFIREINLQNKENIENLETLKTQHHREQKKVES